MKAKKPLSAARLAVAAVLVSVLSVGCNTKPETCLISTFDGYKAEVKDCNRGDILLFAPAQWGNAQIPLAMATNVCDFSKTIVANESGLSCVYDDRLQGGATDQK